MVLYAVPASLQASVTMPIDNDKIDEAALTRLYPTRHDGYRAWKAVDRTLTSRLHDKGLLENQRTRNKSVAFTEDGLRAAKAAFTRLSVTGDG